MNKQFTLTIALLLFALTNVVQAQSVPTPGEPQQGAILFTNATIHVGNGQIIENGSLLFTDGKITAIGNDFAREASTQEIDATGKHIYPGLIALNTRLGLNEVEALRQTNDYDETGSLNPNVRSIIAYNTDSRVTPTVRSNGILFAQVAPTGGRLSGTSSIVQLDAWNWEDAAVKTDDALFLNWPSSLTYKGWWANPGGWEPSKQYDEQVQELNSYFAQAKAYAEGNHNSKNLRFEGMEGIFNGNKKLFIVTDRAADMIAAVNFAKGFGITPVIYGARESGRITDFLVENKVPVVLNAVHRTPTFEDDAVNSPYELPSKLHKAGVDFCLSYADFWQVRNLPFQVGTAIAHGLPKEQGLQAVTLNAAKLVGIDKDYGSLEVGKSASFVVVEGDLFDMNTSNVTHAYIDGRKVNLGNKQKDLYQKFSDKYGQDTK